MNILVDIVPERSRKYVVYAPLALIGLVLGAWKVADPQEWVDTALATYAFVSGALGYSVAYANTNTRSESGDVAP